MQLKILDVKVEINRKRKWEEPSATATFLADRDGVLLKTADGFYLAVSEG